MKTDTSPEDLSQRVCSKMGKFSNSQRRSYWLTVLYTLSGVSALVWFLARVIPKPSRASYPCQRIAFPVAFSFVLWLFGLAGSVFAFRKAGKSVRQARYAIAGLCAAGGIAAVCWTVSMPGKPARAAWEPVEPPNRPIGVAKGIRPGRVVWVHDPDATSWDGASNYWWTSKYTDQAVVDRMMSTSIRRLTEIPNDTAAWDALFRYFNQTHGRGDVGYQEGEEIAIKINMNVAGDYDLTNEPISSPQVVRTILWQLVHQAGVPEQAISVYDASRRINDAIYSPCHSEFPEVNFVDREGRGDRLQATPDMTVAVHYADPRVDYSGTTHLPQCVVSATYLINLALLRGHSGAGVTLCAKNHFGSVWRGGFWSPSHIHVSVFKHKNAMGTCNSLVDLMGHEHLDGKTFLFVIDALYAAEYQGSSQPTLWQSSPFHNDWTSSLFVSQDGVAIDSVALDLCRSEPALSDQVTGISVDNYLHEAALAHDPPSGAFYDPEGDGTRLASLGVHEHWNNPIDKQYSRNLGTGEGIELVMVNQGPLVSAIPWLMLLLGD